MTEPLTYPARWRAGADETPVAEGAVPTPGQWVAMFLDRDAEGRRDIAARAQQFADEANRCWTEAHATTIAELQRQLEQLRTERDQAAAAALTEAARRIATRPADHADDCDFCLGLRSAGRLVTELRDERNGL